jgi:SNF2 family DNA or RNA helicase
VANTEVVLTPKPFQLFGTQWLKDHPHSILADDMGLGKSMQAIFACEEVNTRTVLIVCPNTMKYTWESEVHKWFPNAACKVIDGPKEVRVRQIQHSHATYYIVNYEAFMLDQDAFAWHVDTLIIDEAHRVKNRKAKSTVAVKRIASRPVSRIYELTGTPIINRASELFSLLQILFPKKYTSYWAFVKKYCYVFNNGWGWEVKDILDPNDPRVIELQNVLKDIMLRRTKEDVLPELPPKIIQQIPVVLSAVHRELYDKMHKEMVVQLKDEKVSVTTIIALITRLRQMAIDPTLMLDGDASPLEGAKIEALHELLMSSGDQHVVIFSQFAKVIHRLEHNLDDWGITHTGFTGRDTAYDRKKALDHFEYGKTKVFMTTIAAGGQGISLATASIAIFMDKAWAPAYNYQAQDRLHRMPRTSQVTVYELVAKYTVEERIEKLLLHKDRVVDLYVNDLKELIVSD